MTETVIVRDLARDLVRGLDERPFGQIIIYPSGENIADMSDDDILDMASAAIGDMGT